MSWSNKWVYGHHKCVIYAAIYGTYTHPFIYNTTHSNNLYVKFERGPLRLFGNGLNVLRVNMTGNYNWEEFLTQAKLYNLTQPGIFLPEYMVDTLIKGPMPLEYCPNRASYKCLRIYCRHLYNFKVYIIFCIKYRIHYTGEVANSKSMVLLTYYFIQFLNLIADCESPMLMFVPFL